MVKTQMLRNQKNVANKAKVKLFIYFSTSCTNLFNFK